jgi:hypothetical protein
MRKTDDHISDQQLKPGVCAGDALRPNEVRGVNGIVPHQKINYLEVAQSCADQYSMHMTKDVARERCELMYKNLSDRVRRGEQVSCEMPFVGRFLVRNRVVAFQFLQDLSMKTKGVTPKQFSVGRLFSNQDASHNLTMHE